MRLSTLDLNTVKTAVKNRTNVLKRNLSLQVAPLPVKADNDNQNSDKSSYGENVKMVRRGARKPKYLTPEEKNELAEKYANGMTITTLAKHYGCHRGTVSSILRANGTTIGGKP